MPRHLLALAIALSLPCTAQAANSISAASIKTAQSLRDQAMAGSVAYDLVESLTTEVGPRIAGSTAGERAVEWAQEKFKALGYDRVYLQPVTFPVWQRGHERAEVITPFPQPLHLTLLGGSIGTGGKPVQAEVVEFADLAALTASAEGSLTGKIAYIANRMDRARDGSGYGPAVGARVTGAAEAVKKGAIAVLIRSIGTDHDRLPHTGVMRYEDGAVQIPAAALSNPDADLLSNMLRRGQPVTLKLDLEGGTTGTYTSYNVIGEIRGREKPDQIVTLGGHLDSWDLGTGAIDDGAGVAISMAAGALIGLAEQAPRRTVRVIAYANEEQGLYGGRAYAASPANPVGKHQIGAESDFGAGRVYALRAGVDASDEPVMAAIGAVLAPLGVEYSSGDGKGEGGPGPDIGAMVALGMPWAQLAQDGTDYFDWHHTANDTLDKINPRALDQQVAAYAAYAFLAADAKDNFKPLPATPEEK